jgi:hypothetical protein
LSRGGIKFELASGEVEMTSGGEEGGFIGYLTIDKVITIIGVIS